jgi:hypothetical protein
LADQGVDFSNLAAVRPALGAVFAVREVLASQRRCTLPRLTRKRFVALSSSESRMGRSAGLLRDFFLSFLKGLN